MDLGIKGRRALVTASSGGMGRNIAHALAAEGADLVLFSRSTERLREVASEIQQAYGVDVVPLPGDMTNLEDVKDLTSKLADLGGPDIVVLVSGRPPTPLRPTLEETDTSRWQEAYEVQLAGVVRVVNGVGATDGQCRLGPHHCGHLCPREAADGRSRPFEPFSEQESLRT